MKNQLKLSVALFALGLSVSAFAEESFVYVPSYNGGFKIEIDALYLRPTNSDLDYATLLSFPTLTQTNAQNAAVNPGYDWGIYAQIGYLFSGTGNDLILGYTYLYGTDTSSLIAAPPSSVIVVVPAVRVPGPTVTQNIAQGKTKFDLNAVDLDLGQSFTTDAYDLRMFAGLRYASVNYTLQTLAQLNDQFAPNNFTQQFTSNFNGIGPRIGCEARYGFQGCFGQGSFGLDANLSTALLIGNVDAQYNSMTTVTNPTTTSLYSADDGSRTRIVPTLEAKLGFDYTYVLDRCQKSSLVFEAGYQVTNYFNIVDHVSAVSLFAIRSQNTNSDIGFDGLYAGVKYYA